MMMYDAKHHFVEHVDDPVYLAYYDNEKILVSEVARTDQWTATVWETIDEFNELTDYDWDDERIICWGTMTEMQEKYPEYFI